MMLDFSFIVIGKDAEDEIKRCFASIDSACECSDNLGNYEIVYVDSNSSDRTVSIAIEHDNVKVILIDEGFTSASLGRSLGLKYSKYNNLMFLDSDMELVSNWIDDSHDEYVKHGALVGKRIDINYMNNSSEKEYSYGLSKSGVVKNIGGFLMLDKKRFSGVNYTAILKDEEESDLVSKINGIGEVFYLDKLAVKHHDRKNSITSRFILYLKPYSKTGYLCSLFYSVKNNYFMGYLRVQKRYLCDMVGSIFLYASILNSYFLFIFLVLLVLQLQRAKGSILTQIFFPYKLIMSILLLSKKRLYSYSIGGHDYVMRDARESIKQ